MRRKIIKLCIVIGLFILNLVLPRLYSQEKEDLLFEEIPVVITAARRAQPITESPSAITVIDAEDIRQSGATNIPDILRMVGGIDVMSITYRDRQVSARGLNEPQSNKLLVMIDGRSVYKDLYGSVFWDLFPIILDDIRRIEVVRSPVSSLYGANAFSGVINIITKSPENNHGTQLKLTVGNYNTLLASLYHAGGGKHYNYKLSAATDRAHEWWGDQSAGSIDKFNGQLDIKLGRKSKLSLSGGRVSIGDRKLFVDYEFGVNQFSGFMDYGQLNFDYGNFNLRTFVSRLNADLTLSSEDDTALFAPPREEEPAGHTVTYDIELLHRFNITPRHSIIWGLNFRYNTLKKSFFFTDRAHQEMWSFFFEDEFKISDRFRLTAGGRFDSHPLVKDHFSPRATLLYTPNNRHILRLSFSRAYRNPAFVNSYLDFNLTTMISLPEPLPPVPFYYSNKGNTSLESEQVTAYELGYLWRGVKGVQLSVNMFYNLYSDFFISTREFTFYEANELFPGSPVLPKSILLAYENSGDAKGMGGEISLDVKLNKTFSCFINYAYLRIKDQEDNPVTTLIDEKNRTRTKYPRHKINAGFRIKMKPGLSLNLLMHWVSAVKHHIKYSDRSEYMFDLPDYLLVNGRLGWLFSKDRLELSLAVFNLFNNRHYQFPPNIRDDVAPDSPGSHQSARRFYIGMRYKF